MTTYAGIQSGWVVELFTPLPEWEAIPVEDIFAKDLFDAWVPIDGLDPKPAFGWSYTNGVFSPPAGEADAGRMRSALLARFGLLPP